MTVSTLTFANRDEYLRAKGTDHVVIDRAWRIIVGGIVVKDRLHPNNLGRRI